jgi:hypothetical protein
MMTSNESDDWGAEPRPLANLTTQELADLALRQRKPTDGLRRAVEQLLRAASPHEESAALGSLGGAVARAFPDHSDANAVRQEVAHRQLAAMKASTEAMEKERKVLEERQRVERVARIQRELPKFTRNDKRHPFWRPRPSLPELHCTDGVQFLVRELGLSDGEIFFTISKSQCRKQVREVPFQAWTVKHIGTRSVKDKEGEVTTEVFVRITADDGNGKMFVRLDESVYRRPLLDELTLWLDGGVVMLPNER